MKTKLITLLFVLCFCSGINAQTNDEQARQKYTQAKEAYNQGKYDVANSYLIDAKVLLGKTNVRIQPMVAKCFAKMQNWSVAKIAIKDYYALNPDKNLVEYAEIVKLEKEVDKHLPKEDISQTNVAKPKTKIETYTDGEMPQFPGGQEGLITFLNAKMKYPVIASESGIQGTVVVNFVVLKDGSIGNVEIVSSLDPNCDEEAIRLVKSMPKWTPGRSNGVPVPVSHTLRITFKLN
jgi:TonB family protein